MSALIVAAAAASIATSYEDTQFTADGPRVELSPEQPTVTVDAAIHPSDEILETADVYVQVKETPIWPSSAAPRQRGLEVTLLAANGEQLAGSNGARCGGPGCFDLAAVRFRLSDPPQGPVAVNWQVVIGSQEQGGLPTEAGTEVAFGETGSMSATWSGEFRTSLYTGPRRSAQRVVVRAPEGIAPEIGFRLETPLVIPPVILHAGNVARVLESGQSIELTPPRSCTTGPCTWSFTLVGSTVEWTLVASDPVDLEVSTIAVEPQELTSPPAVSGPIELVPDRTTPLAISVRVPSEAFDVQDFRGLDPYVQVELAFDVDDQDTIVGFKTKSEGQPRGNTRPGKQTFFEQPLQCTESWCELTNELWLWIEEGEPTSLVVSIRARIPYYVSAQPPDDVSISVEVMP